MNKKNIIISILSLMLIFTFIFSTTSFANNKVYQGYFENPDYTNKSLFLQEDSQTKITWKIQLIADEISGEKSLHTLANIFDKTRELIPYDKEKDKGIGDFTTSAQDLIDRGFSYGCNNNAIVFVTLARAKEIPTVLVNAAKVSWINDLRRKGDMDFFAGHIFAESYINGKWYLIDPSSGELYKNYDKTNWNLPKGYIAHAKSLSKRELDFDYHGDFMINAFKNYDKEYKKPNYKKIDLNTLITNKNDTQNSKDITQNNNLKYGVLGLIVLGLVIAN